jgi:S-DNA-T family DNA segregation ATPase FtsK/SpoIIIE
MDIIADILKQYNVNAEIVGVRKGPMVNRYEIKLGRGARIRDIYALKDDIIRIVGNENIGIVSPLSNGLVGLEVPREDRETVHWEKLADGVPTDYKLGFVMGKDLEGNPLYADLAKMPHLLVAGATGSGKSVFINSLISSILHKHTEDTVKMVLIDPKQVELLPFARLPHLAYPVATDADSARSALRFVVEEMDNRYRLLAQNNVRNISEYNMRATEALPYWVVVIDELADLMMVAKREVESSIVRITQLARAAGIHLVVATQRPSVDVITGLIKANMPSRVAFAVSSATDSRVILDTVGAEVLTGMGDGLFVPQGVSRPIRFQGAWVTDNVAYDFEDEEEEEVSYHLIDLVETIAQENAFVSASLVQRRLGIDFRTAETLLKSIPSQHLVF